MKNCNNMEFILKKVERVFITGATGLIGSHLARRLILEEGIRVRVLARDTHKAEWLKKIGAEIIVGDITNSDCVLTAIEGCQIIFHAAAWVSESGRKESVWEANVYGTQNIVNAAIATGAQRFIHLSSCAVYGSQQVFEIDETFPTRITGNLYGDSKIAAEEIVQQAYHEHNLPAVRVKVSASLRSWLLPIYHPPHRCD